MEIDRDLEREVESRLTGANIHEGNRQLGSYRTAVNCYNGVYRDLSEENKEFFRRQALVYGIALRYFVTSGDLMNKEQIGELYKEVK